MNAILIIVPANASPSEVQDALKAVMSNVETSGFTGINGILNLNDLADPAIVELRTVCGSLKRKFGNVNITDHVVWLSRFYAALFNTRDKDVTNEVVEYFAQLEDVKFQPTLDAYGLSFLPPACRAMCNKNY